MIWIEEGHHAIKEVLEKDIITACGETIPRGGHTSTTTTSLTARPYAADTCPGCHAAVKRWAVDPEAMPDNVPHEPEPAPEVRRAMNAEERRASIEGRRPKPVSMPGDGAPGRGRGGRSRRAPEPEPVDDLVFPPEPGERPGVAATTLDGAMVIQPTRTPKQAARDAEAAADIEINHDPD